MINTANDRVEVYRDDAGEWRWRRVDGSNGKTLSDGAEGYADQGYCIEAARAYNGDVFLVVTG